MNLPFSQSGS